MPTAPAPSAPSPSTRKHWLLAYDIADHRRLSRVHRYLRQRGIALQYSVFGLEHSDRELRTVLDDLALLIDPRADDIRAYHIPPRCKVWALGQQALPEGIELHASCAARLLCANGTPAPDAQTLLPRQLFLW